jgi:2-polyprenyl-6-hydroxyphenyl methylase/3-demethylubiquinone-9 3-methyltransferase
MNYLFNVRDWLGGLPYEHATPQEVLRFGREQLCMELVNIKTGEACTEYLFQPRPSFVEAQPQKERERTAPMYPSPMVV